MHVQDLDLQLDDKHARVHGKGGAVRTVLLDDCGTELINSGVSIEVVRRRMGHASTEATQVYAELADRAADAKIRAARRKRETRR